MKVAVINIAGHVGKSTVANHLLAPRMNNATVLPFEASSSSGTQTENVKGKQFGELQKTLLLLDDAVVDVDASTAEEFMSFMDQHHGGHDAFDYFVVPTVAQNKQMHDTLSTIDALSDIGVPASKIFVVLNMLEADDVPQRSFAGLFEYHSSGTSFTLRPGAVMHTNELYSHITNDKQVIRDILEDETDYKAMIRTATSSDEKIGLAHKIAIRRLAAGVTNELDAVFRTLFK